MKRCEFRDILKKFCDEQGSKIPSFDKRTFIFNAYKDSLLTAPVEDCKETLMQFLWNSNFELAPLEVAMSFATTTECMKPSSKAVPCKVGYAGTPYHIEDFYNVIKEEGKTPMRNYNDAYASASVTAPKSDTSVQRDYLLDRLDGAQYPKDKELQKVYNLFVDNKPKTYKELIDVIKNGKYTIDAKIAKKLEDEDEVKELGNNPFYGIIWEGPVSDWKGYHASIEEYYKQAAKARDTIMGGVYADGLKALQDFEAWLPTPATTIQ